jgi:hypothetical protein
MALPALVITSLFGMNIEYPAWTKSPFVSPDCWCWLWRRLCFFRGICYAATTSRAAAPHAMQTAEAPMPEFFSLPKGLFGRSFTG